VLFDAYGTLFDVYSVATLAEQLFPGQGERLATLWRDKQIEYTRLTSMSSSRGEHYRPFWELTRAGLKYATARLGLALDTATEERLMNEYRHLGAFPENHEVLTALKSRGIPAGVLSTGDSNAAKPALSAHPLRKYKTDPAVYALGTQAFELPAKDILFVSSNGWDAMGASWYGYTTLWVNRAGMPPETLGPEPTRTGTSLRDVLRFFEP